MQYHSFRAIELLRTVWNMAEPIPVKSLLYSFARKMNLVKKTDGFLSALMQEQTTQPTKVLSLYQSCNDLPYKVFKQCCVEKKYELLGEGTYEQLHHLWVKLYSEFSIISGNEEVQGYIKEWGQATFLESRIFRTQLYCLSLLRKYDVKVIEALKDFGYRYPFTRTSYVEDVESVVRELNNLDVKLKMLLDHIGKQQDKTTELKEITYAALDEKISTIERVFKYPINIETLTAQMYAIKIKELRNYLLKLESK